MYHSGCTLRSYTPGSDASKTSEALGGKVALEAAEEAEEDDVTEGEVSTSFWTDVLVICGAVLTGRVSM